MIMREDTVSWASSIVSELRSWIFPVFIAVVGAWITTQQVAISRRKLNFDLFRERFAIYSAAQDFIVSCLNNDGGTAEDRSRFYHSVRPAPFLFNDAINKFLSQIMKESVNMSVFGPYVGKHELPNYHALIKQYEISRQWMGDAFVNITPMFSERMNIDNIKPYSVSTVLFPQDGSNFANKARQVADKLLKHEGESGDSSL